MNEKCTLDKGYPRECPNCGVRAFVEDDFGNWYCHNCGWVKEVLEDE